MWNLIRWVSPRTVKETFVPPTDYRYPFLRPTTHPGTPAAALDRPLTHPGSSRLDSLSARPPAAANRRPRPEPSIG